CEVQFDYGLRQKRSRRLADRPASFQGASGKEILVQQDVAARNDQTTKRGQFIHKELERELRPEDLEIVLIATEEERWALRLINFLSSLVSLSAEGCVREIPVFGIVEGVVIVGIIDELLLLDEPGPETGAKRPSDDASLPSPKRSCLGNSPVDAEPSPAAAPTSTPPPPQCIRVIDTKTRRTYSLPSDEDTEPAQLQVMLYRRLLTNLLETSAPFDFPALWASLRVNPSAPFSPNFLEQAIDVFGKTDPPVLCLEDVVAFLRTTLAQLELPPVDGTLEIIYRSQNKYSSDRRRRNKDKGKGIGAETTTREDDDIAKAIEMSLSDVFEAQLTAALKESALTHAPVTETEPGDFNSDDASGTVRIGPPPESGPSASSPKNPGIQPEPTIIDLAAALGGDVQSPEKTAPRPDIIGTKDFPMNDAALDAYLHNALEWWHGSRPARGVSERQTGRCFSCEYRNDCEWREQKAAEIQLRQRLKRAAS
ncbi:exonuclease V, partial [Mycena metata]